MNSLSCQTPLPVQERGGIVAHRLIPGLFSALYSFKGDTDKRTGVVHYKPEITCSIRMPGFLVMETLPGRVIAITSEARGCLSLITLLYRT